MKQEMEKYTEEDKQVWRCLFERQVEILAQRVSNDYLDALASMKPVLHANKLPNFSEINNWFKSSTGWEIECVPGLIEVDMFFDLLAEKKFPSSTWLRPMDKLDYLEEPDMFHDVFGHIPLLSNPFYSEFMHRFGMLGKSVKHLPEAMIELQRLYWYTIEFGLILKESECRILGAGIISSYNESITSLESSEVTRIPFNLKQLISLPFRTDTIQNIYFVVNHIGELLESIEILSKTYENELVGDGK